MNRLVARGYMLLIPWLLAACASSQSPRVHAWEEAQASAGCDAPSDDRCVMLGCEEGLCGFFQCVDVVAESPPAASTDLEVKPVLARPPGLPME